MRRAKNIWILPIILLLTVACEREVDLNLPQSPPPFVVEGYVEQEQTPFVTVTRGAGFFSRINISEFQKYGVYDADVEISDGITSEKMIIPPFSPFPTYVAPNMKGIVGRTYSITITVGDTVITSSCTIKQPLPIDSMWVEANPNNKKEVQLFIKISEPGNETNFYRALTKLKSEDFFDTDFGSVYDDILVNGKSFSFPLNRGTQNFSDSNSTFGYFPAGDTIVVKWTQIGRPHFDFWVTFENQVNSIGNPFSGPVIIKSNVKNAVGIWGDYGAYYDTIIVPKNP